MHFSGLCWKDNANHTTEKLNLNITNLSLGLVFTFFYLNRVYLMIEKFGTNLISQASTCIHFRHWIKIVCLWYLTHQSQQRDRSETDKKPEKPNGQESVRLESICSRFKGVIEALVALLNRFQTGSKQTDSRPSREMYYFNFICCRSRFGPIVVTVVLAQRPVVIRLEIGRHSFFWSFNFEGS